MFGSRNPWTIVVFVYPFPIMQNGELGLSGTPEKSPLCPTPLPISPFDADSILPWR